MQIWWQAQHWLKHIALISQAKYFNSRALNFVAKHFGAQGADFVAGAALLEHRVLNSWQAPYFVGSRVESRDRRCSTFQHNSQERRCSRQAQYF